jgi:hypothetical protein
MNNETKGITTWAEYETYPWSSSKEVDYYPVEYMAERLPEDGILGLMRFNRCPG